MNDLLLADAEPSLSVRTLNALRRARITRLSQLLTCSERDLLDIFSFGEKCLADVEALLAAHGLRLARKRQLAPGGMETDAVMSYTVTPEPGGEPREFAGSDYPAGDAGALKAASIYARRQARAGVTSILTGPELRRRYAPEYLRRNPTCPYRILGACGHWVHPQRRADSPGYCAECRQAEGQTRKQREAVATANRRRGGE